MIAQQEVLIFVIQSSILHVALTIFWLVVVKNE